MANSFTLFDAASVLVALTAALGYVGYRWIPLPRSAALTLLGMALSLGVVGLSRAFPASPAADVVAFIHQIDFEKALMQGMLSFLLFAGALHVQWPHLRRGWAPTLVFSTISVLLSTLIVGAGFYGMVSLFALPISFTWCLVFGALISPTDPVAVMDVLSRLTGVDKTLEATIAGESLFNDGVGVVVFTILLAVAAGQDTLSMSHAAQLFAVEAGGGVLLGLVVGYVGYLGMLSIDEYRLEVLISLAIVMGGYTLASKIGVSGPVAMAVAGLFIGNHGVATAMSEQVRDHMHKFWSLIDDFLNSLLFLLVGLVIVTIPANPSLILIGIAMIPLALVARALSVLIPMAAMWPWFRLGRMALPTLIWGGVRGGISVALALSLPQGPARDAALAATYIVVLFAVVAQGGSIEGLLRRLSAPVQTPLVEEAA